MGLIDPRWLFRKIGRTKGLKFKVLSTVLRWWYACYFDDRLAAVSNEMTEKDYQDQMVITLFHEAGLWSQWKALCGVRKQKRSTIMPKKPYSEHHYMESHPNDGDGEIQKAVSEAFQDLDPELGWLMTFMYNLAEAELGKEPRDVSVGFLKYSGFTVLKDNTPRRRDMDLTLQDHRSFQDMARQNVHDVFPHPDDHFPEGPEVLEELECELGAESSGFSDSELENLPNTYMGTAHAHAGPHTGT